jgi:AhpD family alkylhydroperoxidase
MRKRIDHLALRDGTKKPEHDRRHGHAKEIDHASQPQDYGLLSGMALAIVWARSRQEQKNPTAVATYKDLEVTLGLVPDFFKAVPETGIAGAWAEFKSIQLNSATKLTGKTKELIGLAVAAQIPCTYCIYFRTAAAKANGATDEEIREAVAMAAISGHGSTVR